MGPFQVLISSITSVILYGVVLGGLFKLFQIGTDLGEIKELLKDIRRNGEAHPAAAPTSLQSSESLLRAVSTVDYDEVMKTIE